MQPTARSLVRAPKTAELIARQVRWQIVRGDLRAGDPLPPAAELLETFGVSRPTLREAFRILENESLIQVRRGAHGGAVVTAPELGVAARYVGLLLQMQNTTVADLYEARAVVEPACARLFAQRGTDEELAELRAAVDTAREALSAGVTDGAQIAEVTYHVHEVVIRAAGNTTLAIQGGLLQDIVVTHLATTVDRHTKLSEAAGRKSSRTLIRSYDKLVEHIQARDPDAAETHWREHMRALGLSLSSYSGQGAVVDLFTE